MTKKTAAFGFVLITVSVLSGFLAMKSWDFRAWLCNVSQETICIDVFPPPKHIQKRWAEKGKEHGVNF